MLTVSDIIAKRKRIWEERHDIDYDRELVRASAMRERVDKISDKVETVPGFETTKKTKPIIIGELVLLMRQDPTIEVDVETLKEMTTFVKKENGKMEAIEGAHDDLVMAKAIAHFISSQQSNLWVEAEAEEDDFIEENFTSESDEGNGFMNWEDF